jgi:hypothetical protein
MHGYAFVKKCKNDDTICKKGEIKMNIFMRLSYNPCGLFQQTEGKKEQRQTKFVFFLLVYRISGENIKEKNCGEVR